MNLEAISKYFIRDKVIWNKNILPFLNIQIDPSIDIYSEIIELDRVSGYKI